MTKIIKKSNRGGSRPNSGRKPSTNKVIKWSSFYISEQNKKTLENIKSKHKLANNDSVISYILQGFTDII